MGWRRVVAGIGRTCITLGVLILLFVAYQLWGTGLAEARSQDRLRSDFLDAVESPVLGGGTGTTVPGQTATTVAAPPPAPSGEAVAIIRIPKIDIEKAVVEGVSVGALKEGPGHYPTTPLPGQPGNAAVAGHRTTYGAPFFRLDELSAGDEIQVTTRQGEFAYFVRETRVVRPHENEVLNPSTENLLTLTTCNPRFSARERLIVIAALAADTAAAPPAAGDLPTPVPSVGGEAPELDDEESLSGDPTARFPAFAWGAACAAVALATWLISKRWGRVTAYAMGAPVFLVVLFVFFENFARLLPANV